MCIAPVKLPDGQLAACRKCWQCNARRVDDWVGRCIAESQTATETHSVTLTYGRDDEGEVNHIRTVLLTYSDVQKWFKRLRKQGYKFRYLCVGEFGSKNGRAHWHLIMFWEGRWPAFVLDKEKVSQPEWDHGYGFVELVRGGEDMGRSKAVRYVCKYLQKDQKDPEKQGRFMMSKKPPLGHQYFRGLAERYVAHGLAPQHLQYSFPGVVDAKGRKKKFMMTGKTADNFLREFIRRWLVSRSDWIPPSELVEEYQERLAVEDIHYEIEKKVYRNGRIAWEQARRAEARVAEEEIRKKYGPLQSLDDLEQYRDRILCDQKAAREKKKYIERGVDLRDARRTARTRPPERVSEGARGQHKNVP